MDAKQPDLFPALLASALDEMRAAHPYEAPALVADEDVPFSHEEEDYETDEEDLANFIAEREAREDAREGHWVTVDESTLVAEDMYHYAGEA